MSANDKKRRAADEGNAAKVSKKHKKSSDKGPVANKPAVDKTSLEKKSPKGKRSLVKSDKDANSLSVKASKTFSSLIKDEGTAFPRGGGGAITPLERRQLQVKAERDALLEDLQPEKRKKSRKPETRDEQSKPLSERKHGEEKRRTAKPTQPRLTFPDDNLTLKDLSPGDLMDGRVTRVEDYAVFVQLRAEIAGRIALTELADDYSKALPRDFKKHQIIKVRVVEVDAPNKRVTLTCRTSKTLSSTASVKDPLITSISQLKVDQIIRGFIKNVAEIGLFISLSYNVTAFVRVTDLSDRFLDDWRAKFEVDQLVRGRVVAIDEGANRVQMSLKLSALSSDFRLERTFHDFSVGEIVTGSIRKVEDFGAFVVIDDSKNVSGLCHRSEIAQTRVPDVRELYKEGDKVKAKILTIDIEKRKISFGLKASYFADEPSVDDEEPEDVEADDDESGVDLPLRDMDALKSLTELTGPGSDENDEDMDDVDDTSDDDSGPEADSGLDAAEDEDDDDDDGLAAGAFDWKTKGTTTDGQSAIRTTAQMPNAELTKKRKSQKGKVVEDHTGDLDVNNPRSTSDFELLLLGTPNEAAIWAKYIAMKASQRDLEGARAVAERAVRTIAVTETAQKLEVWTVWFNLELQFGTEETIDEVFKKACEVTDRAMVHERFASCCIDVAKHKARDAGKQQESTKILDKAQHTFEAMKKFPECSKGPDFWVDYARFLFNVRRDTESARSLQGRAKQSVVDQKYPDLIKGFALLEFNCDAGDSERGRTIFEQLLEIYTKRWDFWEVYLAAEVKQKAWDNVRQLYERVATKEVSGKLKKKNIRRAFDEWEKFEREHGGDKKINKVKARRQEYEERLAEKEETE